MPGWPTSDDDRRISKPEPVLSPRSRTPDRPPAAPATTRAGAPTATTVVRVTATPTAVGNTHRRVPTHTPNAPKSKKS